MVPLDDFGKSMCFGAKAPARRNGQTLARRLRLDSAPVSSLKFNGIESEVAIAVLFGVKVKAANTSIAKDKSKRFRSQLGRCKDVKKAYVTREESNTSDVSIGLWSTKRYGCKLGFPVKVGVPFLEEELTQATSKFP